MAASLPVPTNGSRWREIRRVSLVDGTVRPWQLIAADTTRMVQEGDRLVLVNDRRGGRTGVDILSTEGRLIQFVPGVSWPSMLADKVKPSSELLLQSR